MNLEEFHAGCKAQNYNFTYIDGVTTITKDNYNFYINNGFIRKFEKFPNNIIFENNGNVDLSCIRNIPDDIIFRNTYDVYLNNQIKLGKSFKGIQNKGFLYPEMSHITGYKIKFVISNDFSDFLNRNYTLDICMDLLGMIQKNMEYSFINVAQKNDEITFLSKSNIIKKFKKINSELLDGEKANFRDMFNNFYYSNSMFRESYLKGSRIKIGRFIKKIFGDKYNDMEIENFVNLYKSTINKDSEYTLEIVYGEDIRKYYNRENQDTSTNSSLYSSCYNYMTKDDRHSNGNNLYKQLEFYVKNPNIGLLIARKNGSEKIKARALVFFDKKGNKYIDHVYYTEQHERALYNRFALENGFINYNDSMRAPVDFEVDVPEEAANVEVVPVYLDSLFYKKNLNIIASR